MPYPSAMPFVLSLKLVNFPLQTLILQLAEKSQSAGCSENLMHVCNTRAA